ncbi:hypothetical protein ACAW74_05305 [Fibrella sp. WM1]|uniref:hypothetical protein n=1 Tax=Fibrella musci TaxID=3242485 RepID=UPI00352212BF
MKTFVFALIMLGFTSGTFANPRNKKESKAKTQATVEQQLANSLTYPEALQTAKGNGIVLIQFKLNQDGRPTDLTVFSDDKALNKELSQQLQRVKLTNGQSEDPAQVYTARLHFKAAN